MERLQRRPATKSHAVPSCGTDGTPYNPGGLAGRWKTAGRRGGRRWPGRCYQWLIARGGEQADPTNSLCARVACVIICPRRLGSLLTLWTLACGFVAAPTGLCGLPIPCPIRSLGPLGQVHRSTVRAGLRGRLVPYGSMASRGGTPLTGDCCLFSVFRSFYSVSSVAASDVHVPSRPVRGRPSPVSCVRCRVVCVRNVAVCNARGV